MTRQVVVAVVSVLIAAALLVAASAIAARRLHSAGRSAVSIADAHQGPKPFVAAASVRPASDKFRNVLGGLLGYVSHSGSAQALTGSNTQLKQWLAAAGQGAPDFRAAQAELPADLALPPGSTVLLTAPAQAPGSHDLLVMVRAPLERDAAIEFFRRSAAANQWTVIGPSANISTGGAALTIDRGHGHGELVIAVHQMSDRQESMIAIFDAR